ncbi:calcium/sodium antiporter [Rapidithrix thailandica]|uniref:Calcium/sodium antiporter n=1 Tax=Rapidithrix thailandica TaxID=413964 RepID=A0AAW9SJG3_9BACT
MFQEIILLIIGLVVLIAGGEFLVRGASRIALRFQITPLVVGLTIVAFGTSSPELFISIQSALAGSPDMTMGNVIGSNICNLALVLGITAVFSPIQVNSDSIKFDWPMAMGSSFLLYILVIEGYLQRNEGIFFVIILLAYIGFLIHKSRKETNAKEIENIGAEMEDKSPEKNSPLHWGMDIVYLTIGCVGLYFGSDWFVNAAKDIFLEIGIEERIIGLIVLALGTSLPELVTSIVAAIKKSTDLAIGNLMGSNIFNVLSILGITSIIKDIHVSNSIIDYDMMWMLGITLFILPMMVFNRKIGRIQGGLLLAIYFYYTYSIFSI